MKRVTILYFAALRDLVGSESESIDVPDHCGTLADLVEHIQEAHPALKGVIRSVRIARNEAFADTNDPVETGDVLAMIPPVQGG